MNNLDELWRVNGQPVGQCAEASTLIGRYNRVLIDNARLRRRNGEALLTELRLSQRNGYLLQANRRLAAEVRRWTLLAYGGVIAAAGVGSVLMLLMWGGG